MSELVELARPLPPSEAMHRTDIARQDPWPPAWFTVNEHEWSSLAIVPAHPGRSAGEAASNLAKIGRLYEERPIVLVDAEMVPVTKVREILRDLARMTATGARVIVSVASPLADHSAIPIARATDAALLVVPLGVAQVSRARRTVAAIGAERFIGSITTHGR